MSDADNNGGVIARIGNGVASFDASEWDACAGPDNPFVSHAFLSALEKSGSATANKGWQDPMGECCFIDGRRVRLLKLLVGNEAFPAFGCPQPFCFALPMTGVAT